LSLAASHRTIEDCFAAQAVHAPDAMAVVDSAVRLTYGELWRDASALAGRLAAAGVGRETPVGLLASRSARAVTAIVGSVLAGGAYVPLSPDLPARRLAELVRDSGVRTLICARAHAGRAAAARMPGVNVLDLDTAIEPVGPTPDPARFRSLPPLDGRSPLAYVMFTSGSTGRPKGVMIEHAGVLRLVRGADYFPFGAGHRFLHGAPLEFDASTFEIWGALLNGAALCVADEDTMLVAERFRAFLAGHGITAAWLTAPLFHQFTDADPALFAPLSHLLTGGDVVSAAHVTAARERNPGLVVLNCYGPTENTTFTTVHRVTETAGDLPLGRAIAGTGVEVCDGELVVSGIGVARGYANQPELTAARFSERDGVRRYRTGDRCHLDADGLVHFHGRVDDQVKIRGRLVEPTELATALTRLPGVRAGCAAVTGVDGRDRGLVAYVVAQGVAVDRIREQLAERLPPYLCPDHIVLLDRLPLTRNGKVDRGALPRPATVPTARGASDLPAGQARMAELWARVLGPEAAAADPATGFRELGGNSLLLGRLIGEIGREWRCWPSFAALSAADTLAAMTRVTEAASSERPIAIPRAATATAAIHPQQRRLYALWQAHPDSVVYNVPVRIAVRGELPTRRFEEAVTATLAAHDAFALRFLVDGGELQQQAVAGVAPRVRQHDRPGPPPDFPRPFAPDEPVVARALLARRAADLHELYLDVHHLAFDGASLRVVVGEILDRCLGRPVPLPAVSYLDASQWCHDRLAGGALAIAEAEQRAALADWHPAPLPADRPKPERATTRAGRVRRALGADVRRTLADAAGAHDATVHVLLLTAFFTVLARLSGQRDQIVAVPAGGRTAHPDLADVVGMFVSTVPIRARWDAGRTFAGLIGDVAAATRFALERQDVPFDRLGIDTVAALFALQDGADQARDGVSAQAEVLGTGAARLDLDLQVWPCGDRLLCDLFYAEDRYERSSADYLLDQYLAVVDEMTARPDAAACPVAGPVAVAAVPEFEF
jgi:amino acid adenylation domain-containing protein